VAGMEYLEIRIFMNIWQEGVGR